MHEFKSNPKTQSGICHWLEFIHKTLFGRNLMSGLIIQRSISSCSVISTRDNSDSIRDSLDFCIRTAKNNHFGLALKAIVSGVREIHLWRFLCKKLWEKISFIWPVKPVYILAATKFLVLRLFQWKVKKTKNPTVGGPLLSGTPDKT